MEILRYFSKCGKNLAKIVNYLDGMYAFAIWDGKILSLVTDRFSEKPLFYYQDHDRLYFLQSRKFFMSA